MQLQNSLRDLKQKVDAALTDGNGQKERLSLGVIHLSHCFKPTATKRQIPLNVSCPASTWNRDNLMDASEARCNTEPFVLDELSRSGASLQLSSTVGRFPVTWAIKHLSKWIPENSTELTRNS